MSSLSDDAGPRPLAMPELRRGEWTRRGGAAVLGDAVTESLLADLAATTRDAAQAQGYAVGWAEGRRAAAERADAEASRVAAGRAQEDVVRRQEHAAAIEALAQAGEQVRGLLADLASAIESQSSALALTLTEELVGHEVRGTTGADVVARVLRLLPDGPLATVRVAPGVVESAAAQDLVARGVRVVADGSLDRADALVEADGGVTDLRVAEGLARLREVLG
ncbi:MAG: flagellar assembly protein FliH [Nocardioidaceae bacterium]|nr:flagellar assembly protein FliH [Nocardioidaceae bacterium]MCL2613792.1 flagellar assembly protein FliH [Nocardioidaceae bacterium]